MELCFAPNLFINNRIYTINVIMCMHLSFLMSFTKHLNLFFRQPMFIALKENCYGRFNISGKRKVHYQFSPGEEMVEEYNCETDVLIRRAWRKKTSLGEEGQWDVEIGDPEAQFLNIDQVGIKESSSAVRHRLNTLNVRPRSS
jgi:hypothetical protein